MFLKFIGKDGSLGYKHGEVYNLWIRTRDDYIVIDAVGMNICIYESPQSFAANWCKP